MQRLSKLIFSLLFISALVGGAGFDRAAASPATFQSPLTPLHIDSIEPTSMRSDLGGTLTVLGRGFVDGAVVRLIGRGVLETTFVNDGTLTAQVPVGTKAGTYVVQVRNPNGDTSPEQLQLRVNAAPAPTETPAPPGPAPFVRPLLTVASYSTNPMPVIQGKSFVLSVAIKNVADDTAFNIVLAVPSGDFIPVGNAGTQTIQKIHIGETITFNQEMLVKSGSGGGLKPIELKITYNDRNGTAYAQTPTVSISVAGGSGTGIRPTATPVPKQPQLIVSQYSTVPEVLSPGLQFKLLMTVQNVGSGDASRVSAVLGGAATSGSGSGAGDGTGTGSGTGGVSGAGGDFAVFGPIRSSNVKFYPSVTTTDTLSIEQELIVNSTAKAGAYTVKVSLVYDDPKGQHRIDDQVITLMVLAPPLIEISYSRPTSPATAGQPWPAPLQVVNVGRSTTQLGKMEIIAPDGVEVQNGSTFIGQLEAGGQYPLDAQIVPSEAGTLNYEVRVSYLDDFNRPQTITQTFEVEVSDTPELPPVDPNQPGGEGVIPPQTVDESFGDQLLRFILGLIGLDSGRAQSQPNVVPIEPSSPNGPSGPIQVVPFPKG